MKTTFIFGAGATRSAGAPVIADFLDRAAYLLRSRSIKTPAAFEDVFAAIVELQSMHAKAFLDLENIEVLFGATEIASLVNRFGNRTTDGITQLRSSLVRLIVETLEGTINHGVEGSVPQPPSPFGTFANAIRDAKSSKHIKEYSDLSVITFNYDVAVEHGLYLQGVPFGYCLGGPQVANNGIPVLKLHGSLNWAVCTKCKNVEPVQMNESLRFFDGPPGYAHVRYSDALKTAKNCCSSPTKDTIPLLVPPTWNKSAYQTGQGMSNVWRKAAEVLAATEVLVVVGYSLPPSDLFFRYLLAIGLHSGTRIQRVLVINPDGDGHVRKEIEDVLGRPLRPKLEFWDGKDIKTGGRFEDSIPGIKKLLAMV